jgi:FKBP-type peptidyl-prolyl cis-trans isomerase
MNKIIFVIITVIVIAIGINFVKNAGTSQTPTSSPSSYEVQGMKIEILKPGNGEVSKNGDRVSVHYIGTLENGNKFDSSRDRQSPFSFILGTGQVIRGWDVGVLGMKVGEQRKLTIPPDLAYGANGVPGAIPPNATLIFEVELLGINQ